MAESKIVLDRHLLVCSSVVARGQFATEYEYLRSHFCGRVLELDEYEDELSIIDSLDHISGLVYFCGDVSRSRPLADAVKTTNTQVRVIRDLSTNIDLSNQGLEYVDLGEVPLNLYGLAVYYRNLLGHDSKDYFESLQSEHTFQNLTESSKVGTSFRKGVYLSEVESHEHASRFNLLRCSSNLSGPTLAFAEDDRQIVAEVNDLAKLNFENAPELNHVLAQVYENSITVDEANKPKEHKAKIKSHSDKTKDMPANGVIAFCTFYSSDVSTYKPDAMDRFDRCYKNASVLTRIRFKIKPDATGQNLPAEFQVSLYPNSVLLIPLSTNRLYTHEICPPALPVGKFPTRLGYVVRCSATRAVFRDAATFIQRSDGTETKLTEPRDGEIEELKELYRRENTDVQRVVYRDFNFSLNKGDYLEPRAGKLCYRSVKRFGVNTDANPFTQLHNSVTWESFSRGREIANIHIPSPDGDIPLARTTTIYQQPSQPASPLHLKLIDAIRAAGPELQDLQFNNAMMEVYDHRYKNMGFHTDQALDLEINSHIGLFSCYENGIEAEPRVLRFKDKQSGREEELKLLHNSVVIFSTDANKRHVHKIEVAGPSDEKNGRWMGVTLRLSDSFVRFGSGQPVLVTRGKEAGELKLASEEDKREFYQLKGRENREVGLTWPHIEYTISPSDLVAGGAGTVSTK